MDISVRHRDKVALFNIVFPGEDIPVKVRRIVVVDTLRKFK